jgi:hypothetical protein
MSQNKNFIQNMPLFKKNQYIKKIMEKYYYPKLSTYHNIKDESFIFTIATISPPIPNNNKSGFKTSIASSYITNYLPLDNSYIIERMYKLGIKRFIVFYIIESNDVNEITDYEKVYSHPSYDSSITVVILHVCEFFTLSYFDKIFNSKKNFSSEYIFIFENMY